MPYSTGKAFDLLFAFQSYIELVSLDMLKGKDRLHKGSNNPSLTKINKNSGDNMSYVAPAIKEKFETLSVDLKNTILERDVELYTIHDLINVLDAIVKEAEDEEK
jgi:hypothetical protein